jgi:site-specific DNA-methyltransferase (adenine-specific)
MSATFILGDCLEKMKSLPDKSIDCFICDLPYGQLSKKEHSIANPSNNHRNECPPTVRKSCAWDVKIDLDAFWQQVERLARNDAVPVIHFCNTKFGIDLINSKPDWFRYDLVWNKERGVSFLLANKMPMKSHEMIYIFSKKGCYYNRIDITGEFTSWKAHDTTSHTRTVIEGSGRNIAKANDGTTRCPLSVINIRKPNTTGHPTEKPQALYEWLLSRYCPPGGTALDPTAGSFNSIFVAKELGLNGIGIEKDETFYNKAKDLDNPPAPPASKA